MHSFGRNTLLRACVETTRVLRSLGFLLKLSFPLEPVPATLNSLQAFIRKRDEPQLGEVRAISCQFVASEKLKHFTDMLLVCVVRLTVVVRCLELVRTFKAESTLIP
jgi:hypothetical protein